MSVSRLHISERRIQMGPHRRKRVVVVWTYKSRTNRRLSWADLLRIVDQQGEAKARSASRFFKSASALASAASFV